MLVRVAIVGWGREVELPPAAWRRGWLDIFGGNGGGREGRCLRRVVSGEFGVRCRKFLQRVSRIEIYT